MSYSKDHLGWMLWKEFEFTFSGEEKKITSKIFSSDAHLNLLLSFFWFLFKAKETYWASENQLPKRNTEATWKL